MFPTGDFHDDDDDDQFGFPEPLQGEAERSINDSNASASASISSGSTLDNATAELTPALANGSSPLGLLLPKRGFDLSFSPISPVQQAAASRDNQQVSRALEFPSSPSSNAMSEYDLSFETVLHEEGREKTSSSSKQPQHKLRARQNVIDDEDEAEDEAENAEKEKEIQASPVGLVEQLENLHIGSQYGGEWLAFDDSDIRHDDASDCLESSPMFPVARVSVANPVCTYEESGALSESLESILDHLGADISIEISSVDESFQPSSDDSVS